MTTNHECHDASSADTVVPQDLSEKVPAELPTSEPEHGQAQTLASPLEKAEEGNGEDAAAQPADDALEKKASGMPLDRSPSQAQRMGKKKIIVVMIALSVRTLCFEFQNFCLEY